MSTLYAEIWILISLVFFSQLSGIRSQLCQPDWKLHDLTGSCMKLIQMEYRYIDARRYCENIARSSNTNKQGHLVFIFDSATDDFVKGLLTERSVNRALIGLQDRSESGAYLWGDIPGIYKSYRGWSDYPHKPEEDKRAVVMTKDGWKEYDLNSSAYFVCQVDADLPIPSVTCPVAEEGQESPPISCSINSLQSLSVSNVHFDNTEGQVATCNGNADNCSPNQGYQNYVNRHISQETSRALSWSVKIKNVKRSDETNWTCSVHFINAGRWVTSESCNLKVYTKPTGLACTRTLDEFRVNATCTGSRVYPEAECSWNSSSGSRAKIKAIGPIQSNVMQTPGVTYYTTTCSAAFDITDAGRYDITVSMFPAGPAFESGQNQLAATASTFLDVYPPTSAPILYIGGQPLQSPCCDILENETLRLTCLVPGGVPPVYRTIIHCDTIQQESMDDRRKVTMTTLITRDWHGRKCICSALHAASYLQAASVEIRVKFPATVTDFSITGRYGSSILSGEHITFTCTASGNTAPHLKLQRRNGSTLASPSTYNIRHIKTAACSDSGWYRCLANNRVNSQPYQDYRDEYLQVRCAPEHCSGMSSHSFPIDVTAGAASIHICVRAYPAPTKFILYKGNTTEHRLDAPRFRASFTFTNEDDGQGEITVMISQLTQEDTGDYLIYSEYQEFRIGVLNMSSNLSFQLFAQGSPSCPTNLTVVKADPDSVTLSWTPGFNGGLNQNFTVLLVDVTRTSPPSLTALGTLEDQGGDHVYDVTGLSENTMYTFGIEVRNEKGIGNCSHLLLNVSTSVSPGALSGGYLVTIIVGAVVALVLVAILVVVVVVVIRRRRGYGPKKTVYAADAVRSGTGDASRSASSDSNKDDNLYANSASAAVKFPSKVRERPDANREGEQEQESLYSRFTRNIQKKASKVHEREGEQEQDSLYSRLASYIHRKDEKKRNNENMNSGMADVYQNVSKFDGVKTSGAADQDNVYVNASLPNKKGNTPEKKINARTVNDEGLIYVAVEINKKTTFPEIIPAKKPVAKVVAMKTEPEHEPVEYIALDFSAGTKPQ